MANRHLQVLISVLFSLGCGGGTDDVRTEAAPGGAIPGADAVASPVVRTADPEARGLSEEDFPRLQEVAEGVYTYEALRSAGDELFTTVSMFVVTSAGVLVADGQGNVEETRRLLHAIGTVTDQPVTYLVIGSDHGDHTGGNAAFPADVEVLAHPTSAAALEAAAERAGRAGEEATPRTATALVEEERVVRLGGREIRVLFLGRAHTGGDLSVYVPDAKVLFMSEAYLNRVFPAMRSAYPSEWVAMIERAQDMDVDVYVPGHGFVESPDVLEEELETYRRALEAVIAEARRLHARGLPAEAAAEQADFGELEGWSLRESQGSRAIQRVYMELDGELPSRD